MYVPTIEGYRGLNIPTVQCGNPSFSTQRSGVQNDTKLNKGSAFWQPWSEGEKDLPMIKLQNSQMSFPVVSPRDKTEYKRKRVTCPRTGTPFPVNGVPIKKYRRSSQLLKGATASSTPRASRRGRPDSSRGNKRKRSVADVSSSSRPLSPRQWLKMRRLNTKRAGFPFRSSLPSIGESKIMGRPDSTWCGKRSISTLGLKLVASKKQKLNILDNVTCPATTDTFAFIPGYGGLNVPTINSK